MEWFAHASPTTVDLCSIRAAFVGLPLFASTLTLTGFCPRAASARAALSQRTGSNSFASCVCFSSHSSITDNRHRKRRHTRRAGGRSPRLRIDQIAHSLICHRNASLACVMYLFSCSFFASMGRCSSSQRFPNMPVKIPKNPCKDRKRSVTY